MGADLLDRALELENELRLARVALTESRVKLVAFLEKLSDGVHSVAGSCRRISALSDSVLQKMEGDDFEEDLKLLEKFFVETSAAGFTVDKLPSALVMDEEESLSVFSSYATARKRYSDSSLKFTRIVQKCRNLAPIASCSTAEARFVGRYVNQHH